MKGEVIFDSGADSELTPEGRTVVIRDPPTMFQLKSAEEGYRLVAAEAEGLRLRRNELIRRAIASGLTHAQISEATGLTRGRIGQIKKGSR